MNITLRQLETGRVQVKKRASSCIGSLATSCTSNLLNQLLDMILARLESTQNQEEKKYIVQTIANIARTAGYRLQKSVGKLVPIFILYCGNADNEEDSEDINDVREHCFQGLESLSLRCPREITPHMDTILDLSLNFMKYDPNYAYDDDNGDQTINTSEDEYDSEGQDYQGSDDDDSSWKVRKCAVRVIHALQSHQNFEKCNFELVLRFKEREESVRIDIIMCFTDLLSKVFINSTIHTSAPIPSFSLRHRIDSLLPVLCSSLPQISDSSIKLLNGTSVKTKSAVYTMLRVLVSIVKVISIISNS
jgi:cullin-associated NEDD8-dissociated protein 1